MDLPALLTFILHGNVLAESVLPQEWTRPHGQRAGLRPSWLVYGYRGWPVASVAPLYDQRVTPSGRADVGTGRHQDGERANGTNSGTR